MNGWFVGIALTFGLLATPTAAQVNSFDCDAPGDVPTSGPTVVMLSPGPGAQLRPDSKVALAVFDCHADTGIGVEKVSIFLGTREGGLFLGDAQGGAPTGINVIPAAQFGAAGWTFSVPSTISTMPNADALTVYARSSVSGKETQLLIPIKVAQSAEPTPTAAATQPTLAVTSPATPTPQPVVVNPPDVTVVNPPEMAPAPTMPADMAPEDEEEPPAG